MKISHEKGVAIHSASSLALLPRGTQRKTLRHLLGMTQKQLASALSISARTVIRHERGYSAPFPRRQGILTHHCGRTADPSRRFSEMRIVC